jgi:hypothetical protein
MGYNWDIGGYIPSYKPLVGGLEHFFKKEGNNNPN